MIRFRPFVWRGSVQNRQQIKRFVGFPVSRHRSKTVKTVKTAPRRIRACRRAPYQRHVISMLFSMLF
jgi:hypothetical protein